MALLLSRSVAAAGQSNGSQSNLARGLSYFARISKISGTELRVQGPSTSKRQRLIKRYTPGVSGSYQSTSALLDLRLCLDPGKNPPQYLSLEWFHLLNE